MSNEELEEYMKQVEPNFNSHIEKGTIEMNNEFYNLVQEKMARLINENQKYKEVIDKAKEWTKKKINNCTIEANATTTDTMCRITIVGLKHLLDILEEVK